MISRSVAGILATAAAPPAIGKTPSAHRQRRTAPSASQKLTVALPRHWTDTPHSAAGSVWYTSATAVYSPNKQEAKRNTVCRH
jgi:hypothetical protein